MLSKELHGICALLFLLCSSAFFTGTFHPRITTDISSVKRRPDRFTEWEVRKKSSNATGNTNSGMKSATYRNSVADSNRIADSTSLANRRLKPLPTPSPVVDMTKHQDFETGLVIERLGGSLLVEVTGKGGAKYNVICYQRSNLCDSQIVVGDNVDLLIVTPTNSTISNSTLTNSSDITDIGANDGIISDSTTDDSSESIADNSSGRPINHSSSSSSSSDESEEKESESLFSAVMGEESAHTENVPGNTENVLQNVPENVPENTDEENLLDILSKEHSSSSEGSTGGPSTPVAPALPLQGVVLSHHERLNLLQRPSPFNSGSNAKNKAIAANIDQIVLVMSSVPIVPLSSVDRILVAAHEYDMDAVILLNKIDLEGSEELFNDLKRYERMGYKLLKVSVKTKEGLEELRDTLKDKCSVFVGQSGIGKSSLVNTLLPDADYKAKIGALVRSANLGAHTTSSARLFHLPGGGRIIDSPGIRELGLWHLSEASIKAGFIEIDELTGKCKFRNCRHTEDTLGCAVQQGVRDGVVHPDRLESYFSFLD